MNVIECKHEWKNAFSYRKETRYIILHHRAGNGDVQSIHKTHLGNGWNGIGYQLEYVLKAIFKTKQCQQLNSMQAVS